MLTELRISLHAPAERQAKVLEDLHLLGGAMESHWLITKARSRVSLDTATGLLEFASTLAHPGAFEDGKKLLPITRLWSDLSAHASGGSINVSTRQTGWPDESYADAPLKGQAELVCNPVSGLPPLRCRDTHAILPIYRRIPEALQARLWTWDYQYAMVYLLWLASHQYEDWAASELGRPDRWLNTEGAALAAELQREAGFTIVYEPMTPDDIQG